MAGCQPLAGTRGIARSRPARFVFALLLCFAFFSPVSAVAQQFVGSEDKPAPVNAPDGKPESPGRVEVQPVAKDDQIRQRLADILHTTGWFGAPEVAVQDGIVFLKGTTENDESSNPNRREDFVVGIGYEGSIPFAQEATLKVLAEHPAVLNEPEPLVLVENLGPSTVNLRVYFWLDGGRHSWLKVKSSVIRLVKRAFQESGISLPDEVREVTFPQGLPVRIIEGEGDREHVGPVLERPATEPDTVATKAEAGLESEADEIKEQARRSWTPGDNLLSSSSSAQTG